MTADRGAEGMTGPNHAQEGGPAQSEGGEYSDEINEIQKILDYLSQQFDWYPMVIYLGELKHKVFRAIEVKGRSEPAGIKLRDTLDQLNLRIDTSFINELLNNLRRALNEDNYQQALELAIQAASEMVALKNSLQTNLDIVNYTLSRAQPGLMAEYGMRALKDMQTTLQKHINQTGQAKNNLELIISLLGQLANTSNSGIKAVS